MSFRISAVCALWRDVALGTPKLWCHFAAKCCTWAIDPVKLFLERSRDVPLTLIVTSEESPDTDEVVRLLLAGSKRWCFIDYHDIEDSKTRKLLRETPIETPSLRDAVCDASREDSRVLLEQPFKRSNSLKTITVRYEWYTEILLKSLPLENVRNLVVQHHVDCFADFLEILRLCGKRLETITYDSVPNMTHINEYYRSIHTVLGEDCPSPIECSATRLRIDVWNSRGIYGLVSDILRSLTLPRLTRLVVSGGCNMDKGFVGRWPGNVLDTFFARSECTLTSLRLVGMPLTPDELAAFLRHTPLLTQLYIAELLAKGYMDLTPFDTIGNLVKTVDKSLITELTIRPSSDGRSAGSSEERRPFLPKLESLKLYVHSHFDTDSEFVDMVESRWYEPYCRPDKWSPHVVPLREVTLSVLDRELDVSIYGPLVMLERKGMRLTVMGNKRHVL
ncbi:hypothetical protein V5O48_010039 [Marasmius crinis-equi]|uniref:F-box domain-containing protein n=1 Tax=Marasmius crinis-equi TaxID=585013 RepID=A0ABR3F9G9_9AGAR